MPVLTTKGILCCEFIVRIDVNGSETARDLEELCEDVFQEYKDVIISSLLDDNQRPVGELFDLTIENNDEIKFFIPRSLLRGIEKSLCDSRLTEANHDVVTEAEYVPRNSLS